MFILDTNILSAMMRLQPVPQVAAWIAKQPDEFLFTTTITQAEIFSGLAIMPAGQRRRDLEAAARAMFTDDFAGRILPFDTEATVAYAAIFAARKNIGKPIATLDLMIAAIAQSHGARIVTRDTAGFTDCGITVINPWA